MKNGAFVSDEVMVKLIDSELGKLGAEQGWLLDGFPRTMTQAQTLDHTLESLNQPLNLVIHLNVPEEVILQRIMGNVSCTGWRRGSKEEMRRELKERMTRGRAIGHRGDRKNTKQRGWIDCIRSQECFAFDPSVNKAFLVTKWGMLINRYSSIPLPLIRPLGAYPFGKSV
jgi:adenylate kinase family enzyme